MNPYIKLKKDGKEKSRIVLNEGVFAEIKNLHVWIFHHIIWIVPPLSVSEKCIFFILIDFLEH